MFIDLIDLAITISTIDGLLLTSTLSLGFSMDFYGFLGFIFICRSSLPVVLSCSDVDKFV